MSRFLPPQVASILRRITALFNLAAARRKPAPIVSAFAGVITPPAPAPAAARPPSFADYITPPNPDVFTPPRPLNPEPQPDTTLEQEILATEKIIAATARKLRSLWKSKHFRRPPKL